MTYEPNVITDAITEPISLAEAKERLKIDGTDEDTALQAWITAARIFVEAETARTIHQKELEATFDGWPASDRFRLPRATPLISITHLKYLGTDGTENTWASANYIANTKPTPGELVLSYGASWPSGTLYPADPIRIQYACGIATDSPVTEASADEKHAVALLVGHMFEHREAEEVIEGRYTAFFAKYGYPAFITKLREWY